MQTMVKSDNWVEVTKTYSEAWAFFKKHWIGVYKIGIIAFLLIVAVNFTLGILVGIIGENTVAAGVLNFLGQVWSQFVSIGSILVTLQFLRSDGGSFSIEDFFAGKGLLIKYFLTYFAYSLIVALGLVLLIIPGLIWAVKYAYTLILIIDKPVGIREAFSESARMTDGIKWKLVGFNLFGLLIAIGGLLLLGVGIFLAFPVITLGGYMLYNKLLKRTKLRIAQ